MAQLKCKQTIFDKQNVQFFLSRLTIISLNIFWYVSKLIVIEQWLREYNTQEYLKTPALGCVGRGNSFTWPLTTPAPPHPFANNSNLNNSYSNNIDCNCRSCKIIDVYKLLIIRLKYLSFSDWLDYPSLFLTTSSFCWPKKGVWRHVSIERKGDARRGVLEFFGSAELAEKMEEDSKIRTNTTRQG